MNVSIMSVREELYTNYSAHNASACVDLVGRGADVPRALHSHNILSVITSKIQKNVHFFDMFFGMYTC